MQVPDNNPVIRSPASQPTANNEEIPWQEAAKLAHGIAARTCRPPHADLAEEVAQESLKKLFASVKRIKTDWRPYLHTTVINTARTKISRRQATAGLFCKEEKEAGSIALVVDGGPSVHQEAIGHELGQDLANLLSILESKFGRGTLAIVDFFAEELPWDEIALIVKLSKRTCRYRHERAKAWLSDQLRKRGYDDQAL